MAASFERSADVEALNTFEDEVFSAALKCAIKFVTDPEGAGDLLDIVGQVADNNGVGKSVLRNAVRTLVLTLQGSVTKQWTVAQVEADLVSIGLNEDKVAAVTRAFGKNAAAMASTIADQTITVNELVDMQWNFGVTAANAEVTQVGSSMLQMKLVVDKGGALENIFAELSLPQFYAFLAEMEQANVALNDLV